LACILTSTKIGKILNLQSDFVLYFSDLQANIAANLIRQRISIHIFNQRSVVKIVQMIFVLEAIVGYQTRASDWVNECRGKITSIQRTANRVLKPMLSSIHKLEIINKCVQICRIEGDKIVS